MALRHRPSDTLILRRNIQILQNMVNLKKSLFKNQNNRNNNFLLFIPGFILKLISPTLFSISLISNESTHLFELFSSIRLNFDFNFKYHSQVMCIRATCLLDHLLNNYINSRFCTIIYSFPLPYQFLRSNFSKTKRPKFKKKYILKENTELYQNIPLFLISSGAT